MHMKIDATKMYAFRIQYIIKTEYVKRVAGENQYNRTKKAKRKM